MINVILSALTVLIALSCILGPLGSIAIWRRISYFGDATSHGALLGVAAFLFFDLDPILGALACASLFGIYLGALDTRRTSIDAHLGVIAYGGLALALLFQSSRGGAFNLENYLFGNVLIVTTAELRNIIVWVIVAGVTLIWRWDRIVLTTLNPELAASQDVTPHIESKIYMVLLALTVALSLKVIGALLVGAMLIIPALAARKFSNSPEKMALIAAFFTMSASVIGLYASFQLDTQTGPTIVVCALFILLLTQLSKFTQIRLAKFKK